VHQARAEARAEAEAAAEQRLAALDQARRKEREAAVREALALGVRRVGARPLSGMPLHVHLHDTQCTRHATKQLQSVPAGGPGMVSLLGGACRRLLSGQQPAMDMLASWGSTLSRLSTLHHARARPRMFLLCQVAVLLPVPVPGHGCRIQGAGRAAAR